jgi:serpin B
MPYEGGASAVLILPREVEGLKPLVAALGTAEGAESLDAMLGKAESVRVNVSMPKFTIEGKASVAGQLKSLGVQRAFSESAEFPLISPTALMIADVLHAAKMIVDEEGTEAAAATAVVMAPASAMPMPEPDPVEFRADRPFLMIIRDEATGVWFFVARVEDPRSK